MPFVDRADGVDAVPCGAGWHHLDRPGGPVGASRSRGRAQSDPALGRGAPAAIVRRGRLHRAGPRRRSDRCRSAIAGRQAACGSRRRRRPRGAAPRRRDPLARLLEEVISRFAVFRHARLAAGVSVSALALGGCAGLLFPQSAALRDAPPAGLAERVELRQAPFYPQDEYQCGPAALATVLTHSGVAVTPEALVSQVYVPERKGSLQVEMLAAARRHGLVSYQLAPRLDAVLREIAAGHPVIVLQDLGLGPFERWHYAVAIGYDLPAGELVLRSGETRRQVLPFGVHEYVWKKSGYWAMVALPPQRMAATADETRWLASIAALERTGSARSAGTAYGAFLARWPDNVPAAIGLANTHYTLGELPQAESVLRAVLARTPDAVVALNNLAQTLSDQGRNAEALAVVERAAAAPGPYAAAVRETRALILSRMAAKP
ncbi:MAG: bacteriocin-processing peptidase family protein [Betaproteobacteria bacterium]|nr:MAG: bacteriocin-processing peptidase family protein [Betaproteobacteria bacterium]